MARQRWDWRTAWTIALLLALLTTLVACDLPVGREHYTRAGSGIDPFANVRAKADEYYQAGLTAERNGDWRTALEDFRQASLWDHDGRQEIADALNRAETQADWQAYRQTSGSSGATMSTPPVESHANSDPTLPSSTGTPGTAASAPLKRFSSQSFPYSIAFPRDWVEEPGGTNELPADTFLGSAGPNTGTLVLVTVEPADFNITLDELDVATERGLSAQGINSVQIYATRQVAGQPAYVLSYLDSTGSGTVSVRHAIFVTPGMAWHVILLASPAVTAELDKTLNAMLDSFEFTASAFPVQ